MISQFNLELAFMEIRGDANLGSICRLCENFQVSKLHLVNPQNPFSGEEERYACHGRNYLKTLKKWDSLEDLLQEPFELVFGTTGKVGKDRHAFPLHDLPSLDSLQDSVENARILILFGRESKGLYAGELVHCHEVFHLPIPGDYPVLNLSHAVALVLYEFQRLKGFDELPEQRKRPGDGVPANNQEIMAFLKNLDHCLRSYGYYEKEHRHLHPRVLEAMVRRYRPAREDLRFLQGLLRVHKEFLQGYHEVKPPGFSQASLKPEKED